MFTLDRLAGFAPTRKPNRIGSLFTHENGDFGSISATKRSCHAALISKVESHISYRIGVYIHYTGYDGKASRYYKYEHSLNLCQIFLPRMWHGWGGGGVLPYKGLMGTCGQPGYVFRYFYLKQGIDFIIFCLKQHIFLNSFVIANGVNKKEFRYLLLSYTGYGFGLNVLSRVPGHRAPGGHAAPFSFLNFVFAVTVFVVLLLDC